MTRRMKVFLIDEDEKVELVMEHSDDFDIVDKLRVAFQEKRLEIGWVEVEQRVEGRLDVDMTIVGSFSVVEGVVPDLSKFIGTIPSALRKG